MRYIATLLITGGLWLASAAHAQNNDIIATAYQTINVRTGPGTQYEIIGQLAEGDNIPVDGRESEETRWYRVLLESGDVGWIPSYNVLLEGDPEEIPIVNESGENVEGSTVMILTYGRVNVRSGPGIDYEVIGQLDVDEEAPALARNNRNNDWLYIEHDIIDGWVAYFTVNVLGDATTLPIRVPDASGEELVPPSVMIRARYNVRVRENPSSTSAVAGIVDFDSKVIPVAQTDNSTWLYVVSESAEGWALAELFDISAEQMSTVPVFTPRTNLSIPTLSPTATSTPVSTPQPNQG